MDDLTSFKGRVFEGYGETRKVATRQALGRAHVELKRVSGRAWGRIRFSVAAELESRGENDYSEGELDYTVKLTVLEAEAWGDRE